MAWPHPKDGNLVCCDDIQPCFCYCADWDDYDATKKQREERLQELHNFENAGAETLRLYYEGHIKYADVVRPTPPPVRRYPRYTWRASDKIEEVVARIYREVANTDPGNRNNVLSSGAFFFGKLVQAGVLSMEHAVYQLGQAAREAHLPLHEAATTVQLGLMAGMRKEAANPYEPGPTTVGRGAPGTVRRTT